MEIVPYFKTNLGELYCADAIDVLKQLSDESIDLIVTDPPYGVVGKDKGYKQEWDTFGSEEDFWRFTEKWLSECYRVLREGGQLYVFFSQKRMFEFKRVLDEVGFNFKRMLIWHHPNLAKPTRKMYLWTYDPIFYCVRGEKAKYFDASFTSGYNVDVFCFPKPQNWGSITKRLHPAQKPIELTKILIQNSAKRGDILLDPFAGSGTTLLAAESLGIQWIGVELNEEYCKIIVERLKNSPLFLHYPLSEFL